MEKFDIILQAGQSNAEGYGVGPSEKKICLSDKVFWLENVKRTTVVPDKTFGTTLKMEFVENKYDLVHAQKYIDDNDLAANFSISFCDLYEKEYLSEDRKILVIRAAVGGAGFYKEQWGVGKPLYIRMIKMLDYALSLNAENRLVAFLWHQGEHDLAEHNPPNVFEKQFTDMMTNFYSRYDKVPFISGDFCHDWIDRHGSESKTITDRIKAVTENVCGGAFVDTVGLKSNDQMLFSSDVIHFCREAQYELGERYFAAYEKLMKKLK